MKKHLFYPALWGILTLSTLSSCRTEDNLNQQNQLAEKRFNVFVPTSTSEKIDYANGFAYLMKRADELHKSNMSGINNKSIIGTLASTGKNTSAFQDTEPYVEFNIRSEMTTEKNGDKWLVFPKVQGSKVIALVLAYLSKQETKVNYYTFGEQHAWFKENVLVYQNALSKLQKRNILSLSASIKPMADEGLCPPNTVPDPTGGCMRVGNIDGVTITVPAPADSGLTGPDGGPVPSSGGGSGGYGCEYYNSCYPTPPIPPKPTKEDDCSSLNALVNNEKFKEKKSLLDNDKVLGYDHEMGYAAGYPPKGTGITDTQYPPMDNKPGTTSVSLPDGDTYFGFMHTHNNYDKNGDAPIKIFSPADIVTFLTSCVRYADEKGSMGDAYAMVITSQGNYILKYSGDGSYSIGPNQIKNWKSIYEREMTNIISQDSFTQEDIENAFAQFLKNSVKIDGLEVYKSDKKTGATSKINADGTKSPC